jgi:orotidine-5'-phosphate decarboxylase
VVGTTKPVALKHVLSVASDLPLLLPGSGAQGGGMKDIQALLREHHACGGLFNFSRSVLYKSSEKDFAAAARKEVESLRSALS